MTRQKGEMSDELFRKIIKDGKEMRRSFFVPFLNGEPFVFPRIWEWLDYMRDEEVRVHIYTNAEYMDVDRLLEYKNVSCICCGVNAATKATYDKVVRGPKFDRVIENVQELTRRKHSGVFVSMVVVDENKHEMEQFKKTWGRQTIFGEFKNWAGARHDPIERTGEKVPCWALLNTMSVLWDGRVVSCCLDYDGQMVLGDVNKQTLTEIWHQSRWLRQRHRALDFDTDLCRQCNHNII